MTATLYISRNPNPRLALAVARYLKAPVQPEFARTFAPEHAEKFRALNPTQLLPILVEDGKSLWEADAIACRLALMTRSPFWRMDAELPEMIRWISWGKANFIAAMDRVHFEFGTKQRYGFGPVDTGEAEQGEKDFHTYARQLEAHLTGRDWLLDSGPSYADFRMGTFLPFNDVAGLPIHAYPAIAAWAARLQALPAWADPFVGLDVPPLPQVSLQATFIG